MKKAYSKKNLERLLHEDAHVLGAKCAEIQIKYL